MPTRMRVLITVKTYPLPSTTPLMEVVCTAGVLEDGSFVRLFPIDFRYRPYWEWYRKYQWIDVHAVKNRHDKRPESFKPLLDKPIAPLHTIPAKSGNWAERAKYVLAKGTQTMCHLRSLPYEERSLGIVRPHKVTDFVVEPAARRWKPKWEERFKQLSLFGNRGKPLEKIPYTFSYVFECVEPGCPGHKMMIEDWEVGQLYLKMRDKFGSEEIATEKVRQRFYDQMCAPSIDAHFYVGSVIGRGTWIVLGVFWPKK